MDMDLKELEDLAQDQHSDLEKTTKQVVDSPTEAPGVTDASEGTPTNDLTITALELTRSAKLPQMDRDNLAKS